MIYLDANAVIASVVNYVAEGRTEQMERLMRKAGTTFHVSPLAEYEARKYLLRLPDADWEPRLEKLFSTKWTRLSGGWEAAILQSLKIARQFKARLAVDSADTLHVGWAMSIGADVFASFDRRSGPRALALCLGLKLWPEATAKDFEATKRLKP